MDRELPFTLALPWLLVSGLLLGGDAALGQEPERAAYRAVELELPADVLASALAVDGDGTLYVGSAEGRILRVRRPDARGARVEWSMFARTFDHPCGLLAEDGWVTVTDKLGVTRELLGSLPASAAWHPGTCSAGQEAGHPALVLELDPGSHSALTVKERFLVGPREE